MDQIDQVRSQTDIIELIGSYISLKKAGRNFKALCPFHSEKTPSFVVSPERQIFKCFGCGVGGDVFKFLMEYEKMTFGEALRFLADKAGIKLKKFKPSAIQQERDKLLAINHLASEFYHFILLNHPLGKKGFDYLLERGIRKSSIQLFKLGYAPESWDNLIRYLVIKKGYDAKDVEKTGLVIPRQLSTIRHPSSINYYDRFRGRVIFPLTDHRGNILGFSGRILDQNAKRAKYINSPETSIYHKGELLYGLSQARAFVRKKKKIIVVEGELDVISSCQAGVKNVVAIKGSALTENQVNLIKRFSSTIILSLDVDSAGDAAARRGIEIADKAGLNIRIVQPKYGKDPDECARHSASMWRESVAKAIPIFDFYLKSASSRFDQESAEGKKKISEELTPILAKITNEVVKAHYIKKLAEILDVNEEIVLKEIERINHLAKRDLKITSFLPKIEKPSSKTRREKLEEFILSLILQKEEKTFDLINQINIEHFVDPAVRKIISYLNKFFNKNKAKGRSSKFKINKFARFIPEELIETLDSLYLQDTKDILKNENEFLKEFNKIKAAIEKLYLRNNLSQIVKDMRKIEKEGKKGGLDDLQKEFTVLSKRLHDLSKE